MLTSDQHLTKGDVADMNSCNAQPVGYTGTSMSFLWFVSAVWFALIRSAYRRWSAGSHLSRL